MEKLDLLYILKGQTDWQNNETRFSLRSIEKNLAQVGKVFIVGACPHFINRETITFIEYPDQDHNKLINALDKIDEACNNSAISEKFILMNDDFFILKPTEDLKTFSRGTLNGAKERHSTKAGYYYRAICDTINFLEKMGYKDPIDYETHTPMIFEKQKFIETADEIRKQRKGLLFRSVYGNMFKVPAEVRIDVKTYSILNIEKAMDNDLISTTDKIVLHPRFQTIIKRMFYTRSQWEKDNFVYYATQTFRFNNKLFNAGDIVTGKLSEEMIENNKIETRKINY
jgi:hypothetical protein